MAIATIITTRSKVKRVFLFILLSLPERRLRRAQSDLIYSGTLRNIFPQNGTESSSSHLVRRAGWRKNAIKKPAAAGF
ncbi:hypothetical protein [Shimwellia blattae]|uniref:Uncharacterized protein n=1 Tax=Shimwellia blattae (strain ATCC 29907 / DSM 4481 / JCM 1650 / NBRC 105725 / CDC 9005-74) TaxID=630626 RepID=I2BDU8_SHIBC|nr:hypothetical protein [Shimwellia blattae]AFJ48702.1 hypothetical protein EBL_c36510 [Shimwellia blattae DSM 4481 = NBRC 105725]